MSMIEAQIKQLKSLRDDLRRDIKFGRVEHDERFVEHRIRIINDAIDTIQTLSAKLAAANMERSSAYYNGGWIPVEKRLPQEKENPITRDYYEYQVTFECDGVRDVRHYKFGDGHWWNSVGGTVDRYVTAWMERPEPYKKEVRS